MLSTPAQAAKEAKEKGNAAFKAGDYPGAIGHYTTAILADATDHTYPLNRAAAYLKLGKHADAERDCTTVLSLNAKNAKALFRRAQARLGLGDGARAKQDLQEALRIEPNNDSVKQELKKAEEMIAAARTKAEPRKVADIAPPPLPEAKALPKRRRVPITIVEPTDPPPSPSTSSAFPALLTPVATTRSPSVSAPSFKAAKEARESAKPSRIGGGIFRPSGEHTIVAAPPDPERSTTRPVAAVNGADKPKKLSRAPEGAATTAPISLFTFSRSWNALRAPEDRWNLLCHVAPSALPALCQTSLEPELLASLLGTFRTLLELNQQDDVLRADVRRYMHWLGKVERFGTVVMFLSKREKELAREVWDVVGEEEGAVRWG